MQILPLVYCQRVKNIFQRLSIFIVYKRNLFKPFYVFTIFPLFKRILES